ncbi:MAG: hypothetical protein GC138_00625 [Gammaproteobacteria bacterium]|nr:hypothetical protein [Gammaproteobacteria bacterium]
MNALIRRIFDICLLRAGPQDLPDSSFLLRFALIGYILSGLLIASNNQDLGTAALLVAVDVALITCLLFMLLWARGLNHRYRQTLTAVLGTGIVLELVSWPILSWQSYNIAQPGVTNSLMFSSLLLWAWLFWNILVLGHILRNTLSTQLMIGIGLAMLYLFLSFNISRILIGGQAG